MQWSLGLVVSVLTVGYVWGDDCGPPATGEKLTPPWECCKTGDFKGFPEDLMKNVKKCQEKYPLPEKPSELPKGPPSTAIRTMVTCASECVFKEADLLTADKTVDKEAVTKLFVKVFDNNKDWASDMPKLLDKCFSSYTTEVDKSLECKSGAKELEDCIMREAFLSCPKKLWSDKADCETLKTKVKKCPKVQVMLLKPKDD